MEIDITKLKTEITELKIQLKKKESLLSALLSKKRSTITKEVNKYCTSLSAEEITRYSRQMLVPEIGVSGQNALKNGKVLIVGVGGLGCPVALYLASAGIGELTILDYDEVELSNLHRQILHAEDDVHVPKVKSAYEKLHSINRSIKIIPLKLQADSNSIKGLLSNNKYDVVIDGTDNVATRYLLNDACVLYGVPLISGSALQMEAQLTVFNYKGGPCYRCLFPVPPPPETVTSCGNGGVLGPVPGIIGALQAFEAIKIIVNSPGVLTGRFLLFDGSNTTFRNVRLRPRNLNCAVCGKNPSIKALIDYEQFCGTGAHDKVVNINVLKDNEHIKVKDFSKKLGHSLVIDVRSELQYEMCKLPNTCNVPYTQLEKNDGIDRVKNLVEEMAYEVDNEVYVVCRRGNDSQRAIICLKQKLADLPVKFLNVQGGLHAYSKHVDANFPVF